MTPHIDPASAVVSRRSEGPGLGSSRISPIAILLALLGFAGFAAAAFSQQTQQTQPAQPTTQPTRAGDDATTLIDEASIGKTFDGLSDTDASVREAARTRLMGMDRRFLSVLERVVSARRPLPPSQAILLRQIVTHVYCAGEPYVSEPGKGFLGVTLQATFVNMQAAVAAAAEAALVEPGGLFERAIVVDRPAEAPALPAPPPPQRTGVLITARYTGFVSNRLLLTGDVVLGITEIPGLDMNEGADPFMAAVKIIPPGQTVHFLLLRRGRLVKIAIAPDARPLLESTAVSAMDAFDQQRRQKADKYWRESFAKLVMEEVG